MGDKHWSFYAACDTDAGRKAMCDAIDFPKAAWAVAAAKSFCHGCPVISACLAANVDMRHGVVGNTDEVERDRIRRHIKHAQRKKEKATR